MEERKPTPVADFLSGCLWLALAIGIVIGSWKMDRLEHLKASSYTAPGLVPGLLGIAIVILGILLIARSLRAGALTHMQISGFNPLQHWRLLTALSLCLAFSLGLLGSGLPFWLAAAIFIAAFVFLFQFEDRQRAGTIMRGAAVAVVYGLICGGAIHYIFQDLFLVRLP